MKKSQKAKAKTNDKPKETEPQLEQSVDHSEKALEPEATLSPDNDKANEAKPEGTVEEAGLETTLPESNSLSAQSIKMDGATASINVKVATLVVIALTGLSILAARTFSDQGIMLIAGMFVFLGAYPAIKLDIQDPTKRFSVELLLIFALCMILFLLLRIFCPDTTTDKDHAEIVIIILSTMATRLIVWPIYNYSDNPK